MMTFERLRPYLLKPEIKDTVISQRLNNLKKVYTSHREELKDKKWDEFDISSYAAFYLPTNYQKFSFLKDQLPESFFQNISEVVDFGTGPGTYLLSYLDHIPHKKTHFFAIDNNELMLSQAKRILTGLYPHTLKHMSFLKSCNLPTKKGKRLLMFGNSINELGCDATLNIIDEVKPDLLLFIEPGTSEVFIEVSKLRLKLLEKGMSCHYPCTSSEPRCPAMEKEGDWCHQVWRGTHEKSIERLGQISKIDRKVMPNISHAYSTEKVSINRYSHYRVVRFLRETKFSFDVQVCGTKEGTNELIDFEIVKKSLSKKQVKEFKRQSVGLSINIDILKEVTPQKWRVKVLS